MAPPLASIGSTRMAARLPGGIVKRVSSVFSMSLYDPKTHLCGRYTSLSGFPV